ncbi:NADPH-dependent aldehyde reductase 2, chloroplastic-like [Ziziphus jujuba]|uniref:NADPH-dependent aldehyde reductase 2, chloroplastic-like n=1 Tax=Ziziphus jujuba TaxID=326968 RepID=A0ABM4AGY8_ZIZJJ|nr:NADPH-dependent aldehyde reductase 2, chloroplastic-like [Ziziphus jujuba]
MASDPISTPTRPNHSLPLPLRDRVAIVTGSSRGIGRAIALHLASLGAKLVVNYISNSSEANSVVSHINTNYCSGSETPRAIAVQADVSDPNQVKSLFDNALQAFNSHPYILVNSAGVGDPTNLPLAKASVEHFDKIFSVNCRGTFICCREAANRLQHGGGGRIITVSSSAVKAVIPGLGAYAASKAAVETMTKILAKELKGTKITVNCVSPGPVATDMFFAGIREEEVKMVIEECPMGRLGETRDVAHVVGFLASDSGEWINGQVIQVNGGIFA